MMPDLILAVQDFRSWCALSGSLVLLLKKGDRHETPWKAPARGSNTSRRDRDRDWHRHSNRSRGFCTAGCQHLLEPPLPEPMEQQQVFRCAGQVLPRWREQPGKQVAARGDRHGQRGELHLELLTFRARIRIEHPK